MGGHEGWDAKRGGWLGYPVRGLGMEGRDVKRWQGLLTWWYVSHGWVAVRAGMRKRPACLLCSMWVVNGGPGCEMMAGLAYLVVRES